MIIEQERALHKSANAHTRTYRNPSPFCPSCPHGGISTGTRDREAAGEGCEKDGRPGGEIHESWF